MNAIKLIHHVVEGELNIGESKLWGDPDLPGSFDFPVYKDEEGDKVHYTFIGKQAPKGRNALFLRKDRVLSGGFLM